MSSRQFEFLVPPGKVRERLDVYLTHHVENATRTKVQDAIRGGYVLVNGRSVKSGYMIGPGDVITVSLPTPPAPDVLPEDIPLKIFYEDEFLVVLDKPAGMVTHPAYSHYSGTLVNALLHRYGNRLSVSGSSESGERAPRPGIVHRLDKDTSGLMVIALDETTHARLAKQFAERTIQREYWAIVWGVFSVHRKGEFERGFTPGRVDAALGRSKTDRKKMAVVETGKHAVTEYRVLEEFEFLSLVRCKLQTGRTHQIRVHMHHIGHPVFGDPSYGGRRISWGSTERKRKDEVQALLDLLPRQALHAKTIGFTHPVTGEKLSFESDLPDDMQQALAILRTEKKPV
jgi:23S rRNA pseudouridine1911/1915/1917 synthase